MPIFGGKQIAELQQKLAIVEQQYNDAQRTIAELSSLIERAGGGEITRMRAVVEQTTYLFSGTLRENLLLASPTATDDQLIEALRAAHPHV